MDERLDTHPTSPAADTKLLREVTGALDWWREAGVDSVFDDVPRQWLLAPAVVEPGVAPGEPGNFPAIQAAAPPPPAPTRALIGGDRRAWPTTLGEFAPWWMSDPSLDAGQQRGRVPPRGPGAAPLMVLVAQPEPQDGDTLLSGPQGRLLAAMLAAMKVAADQVYVASAVPRHTPMADWADLAEQGLGQVLRHHLALAAPQRVIAFGRHLPPLLHVQELESPLTTTAPTQIGPFSQQIHHQGGSVPLLVARDLGSLLERPIAKGAFWQHWLEWSVGE